MSNRSYHNLGASLNNNEYIRAHSGMRARRSLVRYRRFKPHAMSHDKVLKTYEHITDGTSTCEVRYVLMDYERGTQLKARMLTRLEAWRRNEKLRGTGFAWAMCEGDGSIGDFGKGRGVRAATS